jgi:hypothetical protein
MGKVVRGLKIFLNDSERRFNFPLKVFGYTPLNFITLIIYNILSVISYQKLI